MLYELVVLERGLQAIDDGFRPRFFAARDYAAQANQRGMFFTIGGLQRAETFVGTAEYHGGHHGQVDDEKKHEEDAPAPRTALLPEGGEYQLIDYLARFFACDRGVIPGIVFDVGHRVILIGLWLRRFVLTRVVE